jgi:hypothetical protein
MRAVEANLRRSILMAKSYNCKALDHGGRTGGVVEYVEGR